MQEEYRRLFFASMLPILSHAATYHLHSCRFSSVAQAGIRRISRVPFGPAGHIFCAPSSACGRSVWPVGTSRQPVRNHLLVALFRQARTNCRNSAKIPGSDGLISAAWCRKQRDHRLIQREIYAPASAYSASFGFTVAIKHRMGEEKFVVAQHYSGWYRERPAIPVLTLR